MKNTPLYGADLTNDKLWYTKPAVQFMDGLPVGTGRLAAMVFGGIKRERIALNHEWLWRGDFRKREMKEDRSDHLQEARRLLSEERWDEAAIVANEAFRKDGEKFQNNPDINKYLNDKTNSQIDPYSPAGDLYMEINHNFIFNYRRELDLSTAQTTVRFDVKKGSTICRETIAHLAEDRIMTRITMSGDVFDTSLWLDRLIDPGCALRFNVDPRTIIMDGKFESGIRFRVQAAVDTDGKTSAREGRLIVRDAHEIIVVLNIGVNARGHTAAGECGPPVMPSGSWDSWVKSHRREHKRHFGASTINLPLETPDMPTNLRIDAFRRGAEDPALPQLYFNYGRYLLCACCANAEQPANLQGKWNEDLYPAWRSDLHQDINLQMCYWPAEPGHLQAYTDALFTHIETFIPAGRKLARRLYGCRGVFFPLATDPWGCATPGGRCGWSSWIGAAAWLAQHMWWHWEYGLDKNFLRERAYPFFKEVAAFYEDYLTEGPDGKLMIAPSQSPENRFKESGNRYPVSIAINSAMDVELAHDALRFAIEASLALGLNQKNGLAGNRLKKNCRA